MRIERTRDMSVVAKVITHPEVYPFVSDDGSPKASDFSPQDNDLFYYLSVIDKEVMGLFFVHPHNFIMYEIHTCLLPSCRGAKAKQAAQLVLQWIFSNTGCKKLISWVPDFNKRAMIYAASAGMKKEGVSEKSFMKDGKEYDQILFGIRSESCQ